MMQPEDVDVTGLHATLALTWRWLSFDLLEKNLEFP